MPDAALARALKERARALGADLVGLAPAVVPPDVPFYERWLAAGMHGSMAYMEREARREIRKWYPEAKSVLVCGFSYADNAEERSEPGKGRVARYARLPDYHDSLKAKLDDLLAWLRAERPGADGRAFVDSSPVLERAYARLAGLGWLGKSTMLIAPKLGTYFFIAGAALNVELPADAPQTDHCGSCTACLDACPTDAFAGPRVLDGSKCISYFTIENKGPVPEPLREGAGDWVFGCDVCQEVCPWNRFAKAGAAFPAPGPASLDLDELAALDDAAFKARFKGTPLSRAKRKGLLRNALLAMGNSGDPRHRAALERHAASADPEISAQAAWSLARLRAAL